MESRKNLSLLMLVAAGLLAPPAARAQLVDTAVLWAAQYGYCGDGRVVAPEVCDTAADASCGAQCKTRPGLASCTTDANCARSQVCGDGNAGAYGASPANGDVCWPEDCADFWNRREGCRSFSAQCGQCPADPLCGQAHHCEVQCEPQCNGEQQLACAGRCATPAACATKAALCAAHAYCQPKCQHCEKVCPVDEEEVCDCTIMMKGEDPAPTCEWYFVQDVDSLNCSNCGWAMEESGLVALNEGNQAFCAWCPQMICKDPPATYTKRRSTNCKECPEGDWVCPTEKVRECEPGCSENPVTTNCVYETDCLETDYAACESCLGCLQHCNGAPCTNPNCVGKTCGSDGSGGSCGTCGQGVTGCSAHGDCAWGLSCVPTAAGVGTCLPPECESPGLNPCMDPANAGKSTICGTCPACVPSCSGKQCGDNGCGGSCGTPAAGQYCTGEGKLGTQVDPAAFDGIPLPPDQPQQVGDSAGTLPADLAVTAFGQASNTIPLQLPPGRNGIEPHLSLTYDSAAGNGYVGFGWGISGLSAIARCPKTIATGGMVRAVQFDEQDSFCLDGSLLVVADPAKVYGASGTYYRTEIDSFSRITSNGSTVAGQPDSFTVETKDGRILTYGGTWGSRVLGNERLTPGVLKASDYKDIDIDDARIATWLLSEVKDRLGNSMTITYWQPAPPKSGSGAPRGWSAIGGRVQEYYPRRIFYTSHSSMGDAPDGGREIYFSYQKRNEWLGGYQRGVRYERSQLLTTITARVRGQVNFEYRFDYRQPTGSPKHIGAAQIARTQLASVQQCARKSTTRSNSGLLTCKNPTTFEYRNVQRSFEAEKTGLNARLDADAAHGPFLGQPLVLDIDGNGTQDILTPECTDTACTGSRWKLTLNGTVKDEKIDRLLGTKGGVTMPAPASVVDIDGDGDDEVIEVESVTGKVRIWDRTSALTTRTLPLSLAANTAVVVADIDGDRAPDLVTCTATNGKNPLDAPAYGTGASYSWKRYLNNGSGTFGAAVPIGTFTSNCATSRAFDLEGDGAQEIFTEASGEGFNDLGSSELASSRRYAASNFIQPLTGTPSEFSISSESGSVRLVLDANGDGLEDIVTFDDSLQVIVWQNTGVGFVSRRSSLTLPGGAYKASTFIDKLAKFATVVDFNRDGRQDILVRVNDKSWAALISLDDQFYVDPDVSTGPTGNNTFAVFDANRDGYPDLNYWRKGAKLRQAPGPQFPLLTGITDGLLAYTKIEYAPLGGTQAGLATTYAMYTHERCSYPLSCPFPKGTVVGRISSWDKPYAAGVAATRSFVYTYQGAASDMKGRGALGFHKRYIIDEVKNKRAAAADPKGKYISTLEYSHTTRLPSPYIYPFVGMVMSQTEVVGMPSSIDHVTTTSRVLSTMTTANTSIVFPYVYRESESISDNVRNGVGGWQSGTSLKDMYSTWDYDKFGNVTNQLTNWYTADSTSVDSTEVITSYKHGDANAAVSQPYLTKWLISVPSVVTTKGNGVVASSATFFYSEDSNGTPALRYTGLPETISRDKPLPAVTTSFVYNSLGNVEHTQVSGLTVDGVATRTKTLRYSADQVFPISVGDDEKQHERKVHYDTGLGMLVATEEPGLPGGPPIRTFSIPDGFGRVRSAVGADAVATTIDYLLRPTGGFAVQASRPGAAPTLVEYDVLGRPAKTQVPGFAVPLISEIEYDALGGVSSQLRPHADLAGETPLTLAYDAIGRPTIAKYPDDATEETCYWQNTVCHRNRRGFTSCTQFDEHGRVSRTLDPSSTSASTCAAVAANTVTSFPTNSMPARTASAAGTRYYYGPFDDIEQISDALGDVTTFTRDASRRVTKYRDPDRGQWAYTYNAFGDVQTETSPKNELTTLRYDSLGRLVRRTDPLRDVLTEGGAPPPPTAVVDTTWHWDDTFYGQLAWSKSADGVRLDYAYDAAGRVARATEQLPIEDLLSTVDDSAQRTMAMGQTYDPTTGFVDLVKYSSINGPELSIRHAYTPSGYLKSLQNVTASKPYWEQTAVDDFGQLRSETFGNSVTGLRTYMPKTGYLATLSLSPAAIQNSTFVKYDANGNLAEERGPTETTKYTYDEFDRLRTADSTNTSTAAVTFKEAFQYDALGNLKEKSATATTTRIYTYDPARPRAVKSIAQGSATTVYGYDSNGNVSSTGARGFLYNQQNLLQKVTDPSGSVTFMYTADGVRARKKSATLDTRSFGDSYYRTNTAGTSGYTEHFVLYAGGRPVTEVIRGATSTDPYYLHADRLGSVEVITDANKTGFSRRYDAYGKRRTGSGPSGLIGDYAGHSIDADLGLIDMKARMYDPAVGRFLAPDPLIASAGGSQGLNPYSYVLGNPINAVDPLGLNCDGNNCGSGGSGSTDGGGGHKSGPPVEDVCGQDPYHCQAPPVDCSGSDSYLKLDCRRYQVDPPMPASRPARPAAAPAAKPTPKPQGATLALDSSAQSEGSLAPSTGTWGFDNPIVVGAVGVAAVVAVALTWEFAVPIVALVPELHVAIEVGTAWATTEASGGVLIGGTAAVATAARAGGAAAVRVGQAGEAAVRAAVDIGPKTAIQVAGRARIPDGLTSTVLSEVKNVSSLSYTQQLRDFASHASANGLRFELWVRPTTQLSGPLAQEVANGAINLRFIP